MRWSEDPLTGKIKQVDRPKEDWVIQERPDIRIISDEDWAAARRRWQEVDGVFPTKRRKKGFEGKQRSYVESHPNHLLSGSLKCGACGGAAVRKRISLPAELSEDERRVVVDAIAPKESIASLAEEWESEIARRAERVRSGRAQGKPADDVFDRLESKLKG